VSINVLTKIDICSLIQLISSDWRPN